MELKDYYSILELPPSAGPPDIKKAYRKLAHQYHPDKNNNDPYAAARFAEVKEAYETLTNPAKKEYYLQQRWYQQSLGKKKTTEMFTPVRLLKQVLELDRHISTLDIHRLNKPGLFAYIDDLVSDETIGKLNAFNEPEINKEIVLILLKSMAVLPLSFTEKLQSRLERIHADASTTKTISEWIRNKRQSDRIEKYQPWVVVVIVMLLSFLIYFISR